MLLERPSLREAKQALQSLIPGRMRTAGPCGIVPGKGLLTITICPALAGRKPPLGKPPSPRVHLTAPPGLSPQTCMRAALHLPQLPAAAPAWDTSAPPGRGQGDVCQGREQNFCKIKCLQPQDRKMVIKSLAARTIQGIWALHPRVIIGLQHRKRQLCYTHGSSSAGRATRHCKGGTGVWEAHPPETSQAGTNLRARCLPGLSQAGRTTVLSRRTGLSLRLLLSL